MYGEGDVQGIIQSSHLSKELPEQQNKCYWFLRCIVSPLLPETKGGFIYTEEALWGEGGLLQSEFTISPCLGVQGSLIVRKRGLRETRRQQTTALLCYIPLALPCSFSSLESKQTHLLRRAFAYAVASSGLRRGWGDSCMPGTKKFGDTACL